MISGIEFKKTQDKLTVVNKYTDLNVCLIISTRIVVANENRTEY